MPRLTGVDTKKDDRWRQRANNYYWGVVVPAFAEHKYTDVHLRYVHDQIAHELLPTGDDPDKGIQRGSISISQMSDEKFEQYLFRVEVWAALEGIQLEPLRGRRDDGEV